MDERFCPKDGSVLWMSITGGGFCQRCQTGYDWTRAADLAFRTPPRPDLKEPPTGMWLGPFRILPLRPEYFSDHLGVHRR